MKKLLLAFLFLASTAYATLDYTVTAKERDVIGDRVNVQITVMFADKRVISMFDSDTGKYHDLCTNSCDLTYDRYVPIADWVADPQAVVAQMADFIVSKSAPPVNQAKPGVGDVVLGKTQVEAKVATITANAAVKP